jgi:hypothetical protein
VCPLGMPSAMLERATDDRYPSGCDDGGNSKLTSQGGIRTDPARRKNPVVQVARRAPISCRGAGASRSRWQPRAAGRT